MQLYACTADASYYDGYKYKTQVIEGINEDSAVIFNVPDEELDEFVKNFPPKDKLEVFLKAFRLPGWMTLPECRWLNQQARARPLIAEIGSWEGRSTTALVEASNAKVYAIDTWRGCAEISFALKKAQIDIDYQQIYENFEANLHREIESLQVIPLRMTSTAAAKLFPDNHFDMVFIDAEHTYNSVSKDISVWSPKLKPGGLLCGHDYSKLWPGVIRAVHELPTTPYLVDGTSIWFTFKELAEPLKQ